MGHFKGAEQEGLFQVLAGEWLDRVENLLDESGNLQTFKASFG